MTFDEFESKIQHLIDDDRFHEASELLPLVRSEDYQRCRELLSGYESMLIGLSAWQAPEMSGRFVDDLVHRVRSGNPSGHAPVAPATGRRRPAGAGWMPYLAMGLAASLAAMLVSPAVFYEREAMPIAWRALAEEEQRLADEAKTNQTAEALANTSQGPSRETPAGNTPSEAAGLDAGTNLSPLDTWDPATQVIGFSPQSWELQSWELPGGAYLNRSPLDHLAVAWDPDHRPRLVANYYSETAPLLESVSRGLRPLTETMGSALSIIKDSTIPGNQSLPPAGPPQAFRLDDGSLEAAHVV